LIINFTLIITKIFACKTIFVFNYILSFFSGPPGYFFLAPPLIAGTSWKDGQYSIVEGEAYALLEALKAIQQQGLSQVIFETASKSVVDAIHNIHGGALEFSYIICHINSILLSNPNFVVKFIKRQANMVAHTLARAASSWAEFYNFETLPLCITAY
jgi:hypothetical protein